MRLRCPHCMKVVHFSDEEARGMFIVCKECKKRFRMNETTPITNSARDDEEMTGIPGQKQDGLFGKRPTDMRIVARHNARAAELMRLGKLREAERELKKSLQLNPEQPRIVRMLDEIEKTLLTM